MTLFNMILGLPFFSGGGGKLSIKLNLKHLYATNTHNLILNFDFTTALTKISSSKYLCINICEPT
jgi:hypothetical protein